MNNDEDTSNFFFNILVGIMTVGSLFNFKQAIRDKKKIAQLLHENQQLKTELECLKKSM